MTTNCFAANIQKTSMLIGVCTIVVLIGGRRGRRIARLAQKHADFDPIGRRVMGPDDPAFRGACRPNPAAAALVVDTKGVICATLDPRQATSEAWIEDAFVRAKRITETHLPAPR